MTVEQSASAAEARRGIRPIEMVWVSLTVLLPILLGLMMKMATIDLAYQVRAGNEILDTGSIPQVDTYTFTVNGARWIDQQWGAQVILALAHRAGSWAAVSTLHSLLLGLAFGMLYLACRAAGPTRRGAALLTLAALLVALPTLGMRPQLLAIPLVTMTLWLLSARTRHPGRLWAIPVAAALCANLHGAFVLLPLLAALAWLEDTTAGSTRANRLALVTVITAAATLLNPLGIVAWTNAFHLSTSDVIRKEVTEWQPSSLGNNAGWILALSAFAIAVLFARRSSVVPWLSLLRLGIFLVMALVAGRAMLWWGLVAAAEVAALLPPDSETATEVAGEQVESVVPAVAIIASLIVAVVFYLPWWGRASVEDRLIFAPIALSDAVSAEVPPGGRLLVNQGWASWFEYERPEMSVFVDSRFEIMPSALWKDYQSIVTPKADWHEVIDRWDLDAIVAEKDTWDVIPLLRADPDWRVAFENDEGVLFVRR